MAFGYRYTLERQANDWCLVRFPRIPEALTEGETEAEARANAVDCVIAALEGYMKAGKKLRARGWSKLKLARELGMHENSVRRLLDLRHSSHL